MKKVLWIIMTAVLLSLAACSKSKEKRIQEIRNYEKSLNLDMTAVDKAAGNKLLEYYTRFAKDFPQDTLAPFYLFRGAETAMNIEEFTISQELLDRLISDYVSFDELPVVYFMKGYVYENEGIDKSKAVEAYQLFIDKYPDHYLVKDAKKMIEVIDWTPEELIQKFIMEQKSQDETAVFESK